MPVSQALALADVVRRFRLSAGLSQEELAERSGLSVRAISDLERGLRKTPRPETVRMLAGALGLDSDQRAELLIAARPELAGPSALPDIPETRLPEARLPMPATRLIGREQVVDDLLSRLGHGANRLITLTGPGGVGKTRLALEAAHRASPQFAGDVVFVDLAPVSGPQQVGTTIAQALGVRESGDQPIINPLRLALVSRRMLLVLDNFEHVIEAAALVGDLLAEAPGLQIMITSREPLRIRREVEVSVQPLDLPPASGIDDVDQLAEIPSVTLFLESALAARPDFAVSTANAPAIAEICRRLDGLPLAIELAAGRVRHFPPDLLLQQLDLRLPVLIDGPRDLPTRQRTLRDTIAWSYDLLTPGEQHLFRAISIFQGGARFDAIEAVVHAGNGHELSLVSGIASLVDRNLLKERVDPGDKPRFQMLETIREFGFNELVRSGEIDVARAAHARHFFRVAEAHTRGIGGPIGNQLQLRLLDEDIENIRAALRWFEAQSDASSLARMVFHLWGYLYARRLLTEGLSLCRTALSFAGDYQLSDEERGLVLVDLAHAMTSTGDPAQGEIYARESRNLLEQSANYRHQLVWALINLTIAMREQGRFVEAEEIAWLAYAEGLQRDERFFIPFALYQLGRLAYLRGDLDRAVRLLEESLELNRGLGSDETMIYATMFLAATRIRQGDIALAVPLLREVEHIRQQAMFTGESGFWLDLVPVLAAVCSDYDIAARFVGYWHTFWASLGQTPQLDPVLAELTIEIRNQLGDEQFESAFAIGRQMSDEEALAEALAYLDRVEGSTTCT